MVSRTLGPEDQALSREEGAVAGGLARHLPLRWEVGIYLLLIVLALVLRLWDLGARAMHHDESLHSYFSWGLAQGRGYAHNPLMHGTFPFMLTAFIFWLLGDSDVTARLPYALFGTALVALAWPLRPFLGRTGALMTALFLAFSPTLLFFSRFAHHDILMAVWTLALVALVWHYLREGRPLSLYLLSAVLAVSFATKETTYLLVVVLQGFLFLLALGDLREWLRGRRRLRDFSPAGALFLLIGTLSLPQWSAGVSLLQDRLGVVLANPDPARGPVGLPQGTGYEVAGGIVAGAFLVSALLGLLWDPRRWLPCAVLFYSIWAFLITTAFTNPFGLFTGSWQSLGYWLAQQEVRRGGQPWYYYLVLGGVYEFLPLFLALAGGWWLLRRGGAFERFLLFWTVASFTLYSYVGEKMPWLSVNLALPLAVLGGRVLGEVVERVPWREAWRRGALWAWVLLPFLALFGVRLLFLEVGPLTPLAFLSLWGWSLLVLGLLAGLLLLALRLGAQRGMALLGVGLALFLGLLTVRTAWRAAFVYGDVPLELLVYTHSSPQVAQIAREVERLARATGKGEDLPIVADATDGFSWPWVWYFRHFRALSLPDYRRSPPREPPQAAVVLVHAGNLEKVRPVLGSGFWQARRYPLRWWHPETYRVTLRQFWEGLRSRGAWRRAFDYWLSRKMGTPLGSADAYLFYSNDLRPYLPQALR